MKSRITKLAAAAVIIITVLGGVNFWPGDGTENGKWWLGPSVAWGQEILAELEKVEALVYREQFVHVSLYGSTHVSGQWSRNYQAIDRSRQDTYFEPTDEETYSDNTQESVLNHIKWNVPDGNDLIQYDVSLELQCYTTRRKKRMAYEEDPVEKLRFYVNLLDKADRILETKVFEDKECVGFEIDTSKYGDNPVGRIDRIWFDIETKLPVRIEKHGRGNRPGKSSTFIHDQFEYYAIVPAEMFEPDIPEDFINAKPSDIRAAREKEEKGEMIFADVPKELRDEIVTALKKVKGAVYQQHYEFIRDGDWLPTDEEIIYLSRYDWRKDTPADGDLRKTEWFVVDQDDWGKTSFDFNTKNFTVIQTIMNYRDRTYRVITHGRRSHPDNPMDRITFLAGLVDRADYILENEVIEGKECFGFELSAKKYGTNPDTSKHRLWFDMETKLPVRMEFEYWQSDGKTKSVKVRDQFQWDPELDEETFVPVITEGFELIEANEK